MFLKMFQIFICFILIATSNGFMKQYNSIFHRNFFLKSNVNNNINSENNFIYGKEYYDFLIEYKIINKNYGMLQSSSDDDFNDIISKRIDNYKIFEKNYKQILHFNSKDSKCELGLNQFADTYDIYDNNLMKNTINNFHIIKNDFEGVKQIIESPKYYFSKYNNMSSQILWNDSFISPVKNQGSCGSCWAFSSTSAIEANMRIRNLKVDRLSEQELVDCSKENYGCNGGLMHLAFDYCIENDGLTSNNDYQYRATDGGCLINYENVTDLQFQKVKGSNIKNYKFTIPRSVIDIKASLKKGPISIALDASPFQFRFYKNGIIDLPSTNNSQINHAVLLVGYSKDKDDSYWIIQNSWGEKWGDNGFAKIKIRNGDGVLLSQLYGVYPYN